MRLGFSPSRARPLNDPVAGKSFFVDEEGRISKQSVLLLGSLIASAALSKTAEAQCEGGGCGGCGCEAAGGAGGEGGGEGGGEDGGPYYFVFFIHLCLPLCLRTSSRVGVITRCVIFYRSY